MAQVRWSRAANAEFQASLLWLVEHRSAALAARMVLNVSELVNRLAEHPEHYAWVGAVDPTLTRLPRSVRRALTRDRRFTVYFRFVADDDELQVLAVRGAGRRPPTPGDLAQS